MTYRTIISSAEALARLGDPGWVFVDCRFSLQDDGFGWTAYRASHIPGAVYAHLDRDLSGPVIPGKTGRHPWPSVSAISAILSSWGIDGGTQVVAYDHMGGAIAARLWAILRWLGHDAVAVLDGGWPRWVRDRLPVRDGEERRNRQDFAAEPHPEMIASVDEVASPKSEVLLLDARARERYLGLVEPIDPVAGHIPGARSAPYADNLDSEGSFRPPAELRARFEGILGGRSAEQVVCYCGSGVTANHNRLAMEHAGVGLPRLYPGSWSEWIASGDRPVATGDAND